MDKLSPIAFKFFDVYYKANNLAASQPTEVSSHLGPMHLQIGTAVQGENNNWICEISADVFLKSPYFIFSATVMGQLALPDSIAEQVQQQPNEELMKQYWSILVKETNQLLAQFLSLTPFQPATDGAAIFLTES